MMRHKQNLKKTDFHYKHIQELSRRKSNFNYWEPHYFHLDGSFLASGSFENEKKKFLFQLTDVSNVISLRLKLPVNNRDDEFNFDEEEEDANVVVDVVVCFAKRHFISFIIKRILSID